jgi:outer membrane protein assembly factor BamB
LPGNYVVTSPQQGALLADDSLLLIQYEGQLLLIDPDTGQVRQRQATPPFHLQQGVLVDGKLLATFPEGQKEYCAAYHVESAEVLWRNEVPEARLAYLTVADGVVGFTVENLGAYVGVDLATGRVRWRVDVKHIGRHCHPIGGDRAGEVAGVAPARDGLIVLPVRAGHLLGVDIQTGHLRWDCPTKISSPGSLAFDAHGCLHCMDYAHHVGIDAASGEMLFERDIQQQLQQQAVHTLGKIGVADRIIYSYDVFNGRAIALDPRTNEICWTFASQAPIPADRPPVLVGGRLYLLDAHGNLYVFASDKT